MKRIYTIGETVYDIIFKNNQPVSANAGGAMLNTSVSLGRLGLPVSFISEIGEDQVGSNIVNFLTENNVDTVFIDRFSNGKTALAIAFLDEMENADYFFYKQYPAERLSIVFPSSDPDDMILFGSFFAITSEVRKQLIKFIKKAAEGKSMIIYDPNFRRPHLKELAAVKSMITENIKYSSIVRGSDEDFELIFGCNNADEAFKIIRNEGCNFLVYTQSNRNVEFRSEQTVFSIKVPEIKPLSTIGAGDSFNAGLMYYLFTRDINAVKLPNLSESQWKEAINVAIEFGSHVCLQYDNYVSHEFAFRY